MGVFGYAMSVVVLALGVIIVLASSIFTMLMA
ncbi:Uncharacterised protein [Canicola haemoglobinophilus]|uniref:Uncharacterized protein n=1 Tax=Canicola haemoglobinophilus TaxID=733 RepID=A0A377HWX4_9PAST|nr:Uncharacterised protein [Canicola haemoglobinophilus]STO60717.1 Uncharacterised protein [Canicola haemoglobinophilus]STO68381.1 Uncharacterised protein [Canicola haemoglobinophilus]